jgi:hypothetical protein
MLAVLGWQEEPMVSVTAGGGGNPWAGETHGYSNSRK